MQKFQNEELVNSGGMVLVALQVTANGLLYCLAIEIRPRQSLGIQEHIPNISGEGVPIPNSEVVELVPAEKQPLQVQPRKQMINLGDALRHSVVIRVFRLKREFKQRTNDLGS